MKSIPFLPLLILYIVRIALYGFHAPVGDEIRYLMYAERITQGEYAGTPADDPENPSLLNGPGLPLMYAPFLALDVPVNALRYLNALFYWAAVVFLFKCLCLYTSKKRSKWLAFAFGVYPLFVIREILFLWTEVFAVFLMVAMMYFFLKALNPEEDRDRNVLWAASFLGMLTLSKIIYGYVICIGALLAGLHLVLKRDRRSWVSLKILTWGMAFCLPFLVYTYAVTGKVFYWGSNGGTQLYWMSTPMQGRWGDWVSIQEVREGELPLHQREISFHQDSIFGEDWVSRDENYKAKAMENIRAYPMFYLKSVGANIGRLLFNFPFSHKQESLKTYLFLLSNMIPIVLVGLSFFPAWLGRKKIPYALIALAILHCVYFGGSILAAGEARYFSIIIPFLVLWLAFVEKELIEIRMRK